MGCRTSKFQCWPVRSVVTSHDSAFEPWLHSSAALKTPAHSALRVDMTCRLIGFDTRCDRDWRTFHLWFVPEGTAPFVMFEVLGSVSKHPMAGVITLEPALDRVLVGHVRGQTTFFVCFEPTGVLCIFFVKVRCMACVFFVVVAQRDLGDPRHRYIKCKYKDQYITVPTRACGFLVRLGDLVAKCGMPKSLAELASWARVAAAGKPGTSQFLQNRW